MLRCIPSRFFRTLCLLLFVNFTPVLVAQSLTATELKAKLSNLPADLEREVAARVQKDTSSDPAIVKTERALRVALDIRQQVDLYALMLASRAASREVADLRTEVDEARVDKQIGSSGGSSGSTSLVAKGSAPAVLGFAVENGALDRSISGTTISFRTRPLQLIQAMQNGSYEQGYKKIENDETLSFLNRFSFGFTFDTSRTGSDTAFTGNKGQLSSYSVHVDILNHRDPRDRRYDRQWDDLRLGVATEMSLALYDVFEQVLESPLFKREFDAWFDQTSREAAQAIIAGDGSLARVLDERKKVFPSAASVPSAHSTLENFASATNKMIAARRNLLDYVGRGPVIGFDYEMSKAIPASTGGTQLPDTSTFKFVAELATIKGGSFTTNFDATIFNNQNASVTNTLRHIQIASQADLPINASIPQLGNFVLSLAASFKRIPDDVFVLLSSTETDGALKGNVVVGQAKLTIPVKGSGVKIPLSFTVANRTELIKEQDVRGNIGITFDFDTIVSKLKR
jgi:hypothetical protein